ncbi:MAG: ATPase [Sulfurospirillum sp.]|nr:MAG: ATPase [Sulfurospirillum sp.]
MKTDRFKSFYKHLPFLDIKELIDYFAVFDSYFDLDQLKRYDNLLDNIKYNIVYMYDDLKKEFDFTDDESLNSDIQTLLYRLAIGTRKHYSIYKDLSHVRGKVAYSYLFKYNILFTESSREKPIIKIANQPLKKELRGYKIEDKMRFSKEFYRFWFTFIYPNRHLLANGEYNEVIKQIEDNLDYFISLFFEEISNSLLNSIYKGRVVESGAYWDKDVEIDLLVRLDDGTTIVGECKYKNHKISKNTLNKLQKVAFKADIKVDTFALFSKNGFSNELIRLKNDKLLLFDLEDFKRLLL